MYCVSTRQIAWTQLQTQKRATKSLLFEISFIWKLENSGVSTFNGLDLFNQID
jgi:hypothetical protein